MQGISRRNDNYSSGDSIVYQAVQIYQVLSPASTACSASNEPNEGSEGTHRYSGGNNAGYYAVPE